VRNDKHVPVRGLFQLAQRVRHASPHLRKRLASAGRIRPCRRSAVLAQIGPARDDLFPRQAFPLAERELSPARVDMHGLVWANRACGVERARKIARDDVVERFAPQKSGKGLRLRAALLVQRNVDPSLKAVLGVPPRASMPYEGEENAICRREPLLAVRANPPCRSRVLLQPRGFARACGASSDRFLRRSESSRDRIRSRLAPRPDFP